MSERDGWCHLYLYDMAVGQVKNAVTRGDWVVRRVEHVDPALRQVWFYAGGIRPEQDPYQLHLCRVNFDGSGLTVLTSGDGQHRADFSPDRHGGLSTPGPGWTSRPSWSCVAVRMAGAFVSWSARMLRRYWLRDGPCRSGFQPRRGMGKRRFTALLYGRLIGILDAPTQCWRKSTRGLRRRMYPRNLAGCCGGSCLCRTGFRGGQVDGLGTSQRSKAIQDYCHKNLADAGFVDRIGWIRAAAVTRPWMDLTRVGIYGGSAGGQNAMRALLDHADFYHAAVADCGCHDNRMDKIWWNEQWKHT